MRLEKIKLVGFKSFVDPTTVAFPSNLNGVVGPNGCGKSNIIDAVRWVMGESSAKQLRGESSVDVIFNGTVERKPVGQASVELVFDNSDGKIGGALAGYSQIAIKRQVNRDAQSVYFLNGTRCRRRDIVDTFLGTGMGPRSYAIIEQGMISRLIEAKPEEMRVYLEEVSGISKYKERRRETENRIRHTRENLARLHDVRDEIEKQLSHLKRQSKAAERYKVLKADARNLQAQCFGLQWQGLAKKAGSFKQCLDKIEIDLQARLAEVQSTDKDLVIYKEEKNTLLDQHNEIQRQFYDCGSDISRIEQAIKHQKEKREQLQLDLDRAKQEWYHLSQVIEEDESRKKSLQAECETLQSERSIKNTRFAETKEFLADKEFSLQTWQEEWDAFNTQSAKTAQKAQVEQTRIQHIEERQLNQRDRIERIRAEEKLFRNEATDSDLESLQAELAILENEVADNDSRYQAILSELDSQREQEKTYRVSLDQLKDQLQSAKAKLTSLETLQNEALSQKGDKVKAWLEQHDLADKKQLAHYLETDSGWEYAVEIALGSMLEAICVEQPQSFAAALTQLEQGNVGIYSLQDGPDREFADDRLASKIKAPKNLRESLAHIFVTETVEQALEKIKILESHQAVITRDGIYVSQAWLRAARGDNKQAGILEREKNLKLLRVEVTELAKQVSELEGSLSFSREEIQTTEGNRESAQKQVSSTHSNLADTKAKVQVKHSKVSQAKNRLEHLATELKELSEKFNGAHGELLEAKKVWQDAMQLMEHDAVLRDTLLARRDDCRQQLQTAKQNFQEKQTEMHQVQMTLEAKELQSQELEQSLMRSLNQVQSTKERKAQFELALVHDENPIDSLLEKQTVAMEKRLLIEIELTKSKQAVDTNEYHIFELEKKRREFEEGAANLRGDLEQQKMYLHEIRIHQENIVERLRENGETLESVLNEITDEMDVDEVTRNLEEVERRIERLGPINLAAIDEFQQQEERKIYIDSQYQDLEEALSTLENAIRKIDKETRQRFKDTFDTVNQHFQTYFPKIFGGGRSYLELTGDDLLNTGVTVMAQPPGKKNTSIHLLSGGEKALTAVALVFSLFQLNPAPFCMLDEVDAPLDDTNVMRFCNLVKEMAVKVQFIFITHNKIAIEMAKQLVGVTMHEPGVSRIVAVDVDEAVALTEEA